MTPEDPRHGTPAGYVAGCHDDCCQTARRKQRKARELHQHRGGAIWATPAQLEEAARPWRLLGLTEFAIHEAAGLSGHHPIKNRRARISTLVALTNVTEDDFDGGAFVDADLTRFRIQSLMAAGHRLADMPIANTGRWRTSPRVTVDQARAIRDYFAAHEFTVGTSTHTASRAKNAGALLPLAWDDPGTLAWPTGRRPRISTSPGRGRNRDDVDEIVVERLLAGDRIRTSTPAEKAEALRRWVAAGRSMKSLAEVHHWKAERYTKGDAA